MGYRPSIWDIPLGKLPPICPFTTEGKTCYNVTMTEGKTDTAANRSAPHSPPSCAMGPHHCPWRLNVESLSRLSDGRMLFYELCFLVASEPMKREEKIDGTWNQHARDLATARVIFTAVKAERFVTGFDSHSAVFSSIAFCCPMRPAGGLVSRRSPKWSSMN